MADPVAIMPGPPPPPPTRTSVYCMSAPTDAPIEDDNEDVMLEPDDTVFDAHAAVLDALADAEGS